MMKQEVKLLLVAGVGYLGFKAYQIYTAIKKLSYAPTGIRFTLNKSRGAIGGTLFAPFLNLANNLFVSKTKINNILFIVNFNNKFHKKTM